MNRFR